MNRMYNLQAVKQLIGKNGFDEVLRWLCSNKVPEDIKSALTDNHIYVNGYPCLSVLTL